MPDGLLVGRWRLTSYVAQTDDGSLIYPLGPKPQGSLMYTAEGWMATQLCATDRTELPTDDLRGGSQSDRAAAFSSYFAYCGTYEVRGDTVVHSVAMSLVPNWVGTSQMRDFEVNDDELLLRTPPIEVEGRLLVHEFRWQREE
jgi:Lipocalin-like domain